ncbi:hypothetical protein Tco_0238339 [Tanacetum coccineum]
MLNLGTPLEGGNVESQSKYRTDLKCQFGKHDEREYMEYEAEIKRDPWGYAQSYTRSSGSTTLERRKQNNFNPLDNEKWCIFSYDSPACLLLEQGTPSCSEESIDTVDSSHDMQELEGSQDDEVGSHLLENVVSRWHVCKPICITFYRCGEGLLDRCLLQIADLSFCSGMMLFMDNRESGMLKQDMLSRSRK